MSHVDKQLAGEVVAAGGAPTSDVAPAGCFRLVLVLLLLPLCSLMLEELHACMKTSEALLLLYFETLLMLTYTPAQNFSEPICNAVQYVSSPLPKTSSAASFRMCCVLACHSDHCCISSMSLRLLSLVKSL
uniref:Nucleic acid binding protein n=1 Tax=Arundo donax TaxID=35708 RepID=A0A0A9DE47_ARUDO